MKRLIAGFVLGAGLVVAQVEPTATMTPTGPSYTELKAYLGLTDAQITALQAVQTGIQTQAKALQTSINNDQTQINTQLASKSPSAAIIGQLEIDIYNNRQKIAALGTSVYTQAIGVLTLPNQLTKLAALQAAADLSPTIREASMLNLLKPSANMSGPTGGFGPRRMGPPGAGAMTGPGGPMQHFGGRGH